jgi:hypothetical protein
MSSNGGFELSAPGSIDDLGPTRQKSRVVQPTDAGMIIKTVIFTIDVDLVCRHCSSVEKYGINS